MSLVLGISAGVAMPLREAVIGRLLVERRLTTKCRRCDRFDIVALFQCVAIPEIVDKLDCQSSRERPYKKWSILPIDLVFPYTL
jgi:hypothetical protein